MIFSLYLEEIFKVAQPYEHYTGCENINFPERLNLRFHTKALRLLMRRATYSKVLWTQNANSGFAPEPPIRTQGQVFQNAGDHLPSSYCSFCGQPHVSGSMGRNSKSYLMKANYFPW